MPGIFMEFTMAIWALVLLVDYIEDVMHVYHIIPALLPISSNMAGLFNKFRTTA
jgi:hypothetical protein